MGRIHWRKIWEIVQQRNPDGSAKAFSMVYVKKSTGEKITVTGCTCTSIHTKGPTLNILYPGETKPKSIRKCLILEFNNLNVYI